MKTIILKELIKAIICETLQIMKETHERGEWWIDDTGGTIFADIDIGDSGHEGVVISNVAHEILSHFGIDTDDAGYLSEYEDRIKEELIADGKMSEQDLKDWEASSGSRSPYGVILRKLIEDKAYPTPEQAGEALSIAYGNGKDARDYALKYWRWKIMKTSGSDIEIQTWHLKPEDLNIIVRGIWEIMEDNPEDTEDPDNEVGEDNYPGPRVNVTVQASGKTFHDIPLAVLEKKVPSSLINYRRDKVWMREELTEDYHHRHKEYRLYEGYNKIIAVFEDNSRLFFEVHFRDKRGEDKEKWRRKAFTTWKSLANEIHSDVQLTEVGNPVQKSWKASFEEALKHPKLNDFIREPHHQKVFDDKNTASCIDPVNFTSFG